MNLDLPLEDPAGSELDRHLAEIDRALDALFLEDVAETVERLRAERGEPDVTAA